MQTARRLQFNRQVNTFLNSREFEEHVVETVSDILEVYLYFNDWVAHVGYLRNSLLEAPYVPRDQLRTVAFYWVALYHLLPRLTDALHGQTYPLDLDLLSVSTMRIYIRGRSYIRNLYMISRQADISFQEAIQDTLDVLQGNDSEDN